MATVNLLGKILPSQNKRRFLPEILVAAISAFYSVYILSWNFINPLSTKWLYGNQDHIRDDAGHAIGSLFYMNEAWKWPIGKFTSYGGEVAPSIVYWAISPMYAIPAKVISKLGIYDGEFQFIGIQVLVGFVLTPVSLYFLSRRLGAEVLPAAVVSLSILLFPTLLGKWANESLASQFIVVIGILLLLSPENSVKKTLKWVGLSVLAVGTNSYFVPIVLALCIAEMVVLQRSNRSELRKNIRSFAASVFITLALQYAFGGFLISTLELGTGAEGLSIFSGNLFSLFDSRQYGLLGGTPAQSWEGFNYLGFAAIISIVAFLILYSRNNLNKESIFKTLEFKILMIVSIAFYIYSLGPKVKIGSILQLDLSSFFSEKLILLYSIFRALGRFQWPLYYILVALSSVGVTYLIRHLSNKRDRDLSRPFSLILCSAFILTSATDMHYLNSAIRSISHKDSAFKQEFDSKLQSQFNSSNGIQVVPAYHGNPDGSLPWRYLSAYALRADMNFNSFGFYARYDLPLAEKIQGNEFESFIKCNWKSDIIYLVESELLKKLSCTFQIQQIYSEGPWVLVKKVTL